MTISGFLFCLMAVVTGLNTQVSKPPPTPIRRPLPNHAKAITRCTGWVEPYYLWRNQNTLLTFHGDTDTEMLKGVEEYHLDIRRRNRLDTFNQAWRNHEDSYYRYVTGDNEDQEQSNKGSRLYRAAVSPDGKWIVWFAHMINGGGLPGIWMTATLDGKHWTDRPTELGREDCVWSLAWSPRSRKWIGLFLHKPAGVVYDVYTQRDRPFDFSSQVRLPRVQEKSWKMFAQRSNGHLLLKCQYEAYNLENNDVLFADIPWQPESGAVKQWTIHIPPDAYAREIAFSPTGDRLLWNLEFAPSFSDADLPDRLSKAQLKQFHHEIWLSNLDGSRMRRLESLIVDTSNEPDFLGRRGVMGLQWAPDGKHISYIYDRTLYLVALP
jgi:hypothetical protein